MGHRGPGIRRGDPQQMWSLVAEQAPDIVFAQEAPAPALVSFPGYDMAFRAVSAQHIGYVVAIRTTSGQLDPVPVSTHRDDLAVWAEVDGVGRALLTTTRVEAQRKPNQALDRAAQLAGSDALLLGGDFNAGPSIGTQNPCAYAASVGVRELSCSAPEQNTIRTPRQTGDYQVDHLFGRGFPEPKRTVVLPVTENDGQLWSYHNPVIVELE
jgi:endonuclease/exonuclease/phosphatase family metal-dependent hydrolase